MKKITLISFLFLQSLFVQTTGLQGKWTYVKFETNEKLDDESKALMNQMMSAMSWDFKDDGSYTFQKSKRKQENGTWKADKEFITTQSSEGNTEKIKFFQNHKDTLKLEIEKNSYVVFGRMK